MPTFGSSPVVQASFEKLVTRTTENICPLQGESVLYVKLCAYNSDNLFINTVNVLCIVSGLREMVECHSNFNLLKECVGAQNGPLSNAIVFCTVLDFC